MQLPHARVRRTAADPSDDPSILDRNAKGAEAETLLDFLESVLQVFPRVRREVTKAVDEKLRAACASGLVGGIEITMST